MGQLERKLDDDAIARARLGLGKPSEPGVSRQYARP